MLAAKNFQTGLRHAAPDRVRAVRHAPALRTSIPPPGRSVAASCSTRCAREVAVLVPPACNRFPNSFSHIFARRLRGRLLQLQVGRSAVGGRLQRVRGTGRARPGGRAHASATRSSPSAAAARRPNRSAPSAGASRRVDALLRHSGMTGHDCGMKLATWNVNSLKVRLPHLIDWLAKAQPDVVCLQELKLEDAKFPRAELEAAGYQAAFSGQKTYNGVAILARTRAGGREHRHPGFADEQKRVIAATVDGVRVVCVYCPNGQAVGSREVRLQAALVRGAEGLPRRGTGAPSATRGRGRLQRRARRPRRARSEGLGRPGAGVGARARGAARAARARA